MPYVASAPIPDNLQKFELRCWSRARLYAAGELTLHEAVDPLVGIALECGINDTDLAQLLMARAFAAVRDDIAPALKAALAVRS